MVPVPVDGLTKVSIALFLKINCAKFVLPVVAVTDPVVAVVPPTFEPSIIRISVAADAALTVPVPSKDVFHLELVEKLILLAVPLPPIQ